MWVSPFRHLRIKEYLLLPAAFRSLSRLSSALSAKASTLRSFLLDLFCFSFYSVRNWVFAFFNALSTFNIDIWFVANLRLLLGCLDKNLFINLCMKFSRYKSHFVLRTHALEVALQLLMTIRSKNKFAHAFANLLYLYKFIGEWRWRDSNS